jgi:phosphonate transport system substrate-binding protein
VRRLSQINGTRPVISIIALLATGLLFALVVSGCGNYQNSMSGATPTLTVTATFPPTLTPTPVPPGKPENPFIIGLVSENNDPIVFNAANELAARISNLAKVSARGMVYRSYSQLIDDLSFEKVHIAWLPPLTYLYASQRGLADVALLTNHFGVYQYGTQFLANIESNFTPYYDPVSGLNSADAPTALSQFQNLRPCLVEPQSVSGYIVPAGLLRLNTVDTLPAVISQNHTSVVRALYIKGICDFGATFAISGDPRTASAVLNDLPNATNQIVIIWRSDAVIPNLNLSLLSGLSEGDRIKLTNAFLELAKTPEGKMLLSQSSGNYQIDDIKAVKDDIYKPLREMTTALDLDLQETIGK